MDVLGEWYSELYKNVLGNLSFVPTLFGLFTVQWTF